MVYPLCTTIPSDARPQEASFAGRVQARGVLGKIRCKIHAEKLFNPKLDERSDWG
jgi:hypothetical protein